MSRPADIFVPPGTTDERAILGRASILLSASVPYLRQGRLDPAARDANEEFVRTARPDRIRDAVVELCRFAFARDVNIVFGAEPAISALVLHAGRHFARGHLPTVAIFQSAYFYGSAPQATLDLAEWSFGRLLWIEAQPGPDEKARRARSLERMRQIMVRESELIGAVFIGGMDGVLQESKIVDGDARRIPRFAIGSAGGAAYNLLASGGHHGGYADRQILESSLSYPLVMQRIFTELGRP